MDHPCCVGPGRPRQAPAGPGRPVGHSLSRPPADPRAAYPPYSDILRSAFCQTGSFFGSRAAPRPDRAARPSLGEQKPAHAPRHFWPDRRSARQRPMGCCRQAKCQPAARPTRLSFRCPPARRRGTMMRPEPTHRDQRTTQPHNCRRARHHLGAAADA